MEKMTNVKALAFAIENGEFPTEVTEKLKAIKASFEKKSASKKATKTQEANVGIKDEIVEFLADGKSYTATEIMKGIGLESIQKVSALLKQLKDEGKIVKTMDKKKALFSVTTDEVTE